MMMTIRRAARAAAFGLAASAAMGVQANTAVLAMDSLPTAQGWAYDSCWWGCHVPTASDAWTADGTSLTLNSYAGAQGASVTGFSLLGAVDSALPFTIDATLKVTDSSGSFFYLAGSTATSTVFISLSTSVLRIESAAGGTDVALDATAFHDYRIAAAPGGVVTVNVDGSNVYTGANTWLAIDPHTIANSLSFGDGTSGAYGTAVMTSYSFSQNAVPVPEAGSLSLMLLGLTAVLWRRRSAAER